MTSSPTTHANQEPNCYSIAEFCQSHRICRGTYYNMQAAGKGPRETRAMSRVLISREAAADWRAGAGA
jgi:hypothetical protein